MIRCAKCKWFTSNNRYWLDGWEERVVDVKGDCKRCGPDVDVEWGAYEDLVGWPKE